MPNSFETAFPNIHHWITSQGWIEIGSDENSDSLIRALDTGGLIWESQPSHKSIDQAFQSLETYLESWFRENE